MPLVFTVDVVLLLCAVAVDDIQRIDEGVYRHQIRILVHGAAEVVIVAYVVLVAVNSRISAKAANRIELSVFIRKNMEHRTGKHPDPHVKSIVENIFQEGTTIK